MSKSPILILCPSGHRRKAQMTPNSNLLQVLEEMCSIEQLDSAEWGLIHQRKKLDLTIPWRLLAIPSNALLEMFKLDERRAVKDISIQLQMSDGQRLIGSFQPTKTLHEILISFEEQTNSKFICSAESIPICSYMSEEIIGIHALSNTTLRDLGLTGGSAVIRFSHRTISDEDLKKINDRIDEKLARRRQIPSEKKIEATPTVVVPTTFELPVAPPTTMTTTTTAAPTTWSPEQFSIFREIPPDPPKPKQPKSSTLAEALGIRINFDEQPISQPDFSDFKFPETTKGQNLFETNSTTNNSNDEFSSSSATFDRHPIVYDLNQIESSTSSSSEELPDSFFELTADDLRSVLQTLRHQSSEETPLETRSMRDRIQSARTVQYETIAIRFLINRQYVLQGLFKSSETIVELTEFVRRHLICPHLHQVDFYLYTSPPRQILSDRKKTLLDYDLAPAAMVYLGHRKVTPLQIDLNENLRRGSFLQANEIVKDFVFKRGREMTDDELKSLTSTTTSNKRTTNPTDDQQLKDKFRKFLPGKK